MKRLWWWYFYGAIAGAWVVIIIVTAFAKPCKAQAPDAPHRLGVGFNISDGVRAYLAKEWDAQATNANQVERAYCLGGYMTRVPQGLLFELTTVQAPDSVADATPYGVDYKCPGNTVDLHTHTPTTCDQPTAAGKGYANCKFGGDDAHLCYPSSTDIHVGNADGLPLSLIQCDREAIVPYQAYRHLPPDLRQPVAPVSPLGAQT